MDTRDENSKPGRKPVLDDSQAEHGNYLLRSADAPGASARRVQVARSKKQNGGPRNVNSLGQYRPFARSRAILQFAARATGPQNAGRKTRKIAGRNAPLALPRRAATPVLANRASQNLPPSGEKNAKSFEEFAPTFGKSAPEHAKSCFTRDTTKFDSTGSPQAAPRRSPRR